MTAVSPSSVGSDHTAGEPLSPNQEHGLDASILNQIMNPMQHQSSFPGPSTFEDNGHRLNMKPNELDQMETSMLVDQDLYHSSYRNDYINSPVSSMNSPHTPPEQHNGMDHTMNDYTNNITSNCMRKYQMKHGTGPESGRPYNILNINQQPGENNNYQMCLKQEPEASF